VRRCCAAFPNYAGRTPNRASPFVILHLSGTTGGIVLPSSWLFLQPDYSLPFGKFAGLSHPP
jgi:hypothetical protein